MSQHISGHVANTTTHEYGEFIQIGDMRIRKSVLIAYRAHENKNPETKESQWGVMYYTGGQWQFKDMENKEQTDNEVARLDWLYAKDYK